MSKLQRGVFWVTDIENAEMIIVSAACDSNGNFTEEISQEYLSEKGNEFNHRRVWESLHNSHDFDFYPRGRVQIRNRKAVIFCSPHLCNDLILQKVKQLFGLDISNGITNVRMIADGSEHYKSYPDR